MPSWRKLLTTGADADLGNLNVINAVTASFFTGSLFTGSFAGDGSLLTDVDISVIEVATVYDTFTSVTTKNLVHNFGTKNVIVTAYNNLDQQIIPASVTTTDDNTVSITFFTSTTGRVVVAKGGHMVEAGNVAQVATVSDVFTSVSSKSVTHNFGTKDVIVMVYDNSDQQVVPSSVTTTDIDTVDITFFTNTTGRVVVAKGGHVVSGSIPSDNITGFDEKVLAKLNTQGVISGSAGTLNYTGSLNVSGDVTFSNLGTGTVSATNGVLSTTSDMNLKVEDGYIDKALDKVMNLKPRYYHWKEESGLPTDLRQLGFYAQEVNAALGEEAANTPKSENEKWGIHDRGIIAMLTKATQEQQELLDNLKSRIKTLENN